MDWVTDSACALKITVDGMNAVVAAWDNKLADLFYIAFYSRSPEEDGGWKRISFLAFDKCPSAVKPPWWDSRGPTRPRT